MVRDAELGITWRKQNEKARGSSGAFAAKRVILYQPIRATTYYTKIGYQLLSITMLSANHLPTINSFKTADHSSNVIL